MNFYVKVTLSVAVLILLALGGVFLFSSSEEKVIQKLLEDTLAAAEAGDEEKVIAVVSPNYRNGAETYDNIVRRIRWAVSQRFRPAKVKGSTIQVSDDDADVNVTVIVGALQFKREFALHLSLKKENGLWKVTSADEVGR